MSKYYKVVKLFDDKLTSINSITIITYTVGQVTHPLPNTGGVFVFKKLEDAKKFYYSNCGYNIKLRIYECKVTNPRELKVRADIDAYSMCEFWLEYFKCRKNHRSVNKMEKSYTWAAPSGTYLASSVTLIKEYTND